MYCAIIGDIIRSREIENRDILQEKYKAVFKSINQEFHDDIEAYFQIRDGDSFVGLLNCPKHLADIIMLIRLAIIPNQIRIGIGFGGIKTKIDKFDIQAIDGSAYNIARDAMDYISEYKSKYEKIYQTTILKFDRKISLDENTYKTCEIYENLTNCIFCACSFIEKNWDKIHSETILKKMKNKTQREIGRELGITQSAVQKRIARVTSVIKNIAAFLVILKPVNITFYRLFNIDLLAKSEIDDKDDKGQVEKKAIGAGSIIGYMERIVTLILLIAGQYTAMGFIIAGKTIVRIHSKIKQEFLIIGTFYGIIASLAAYIVFFIF